MSDDTRDLTITNEDSDSVMMHFDPSLLAQQPPPLQDIPVIRGVFKQEDIGHIVKQLKQMDGIHDVRIDTTPDGNAEVRVLAECPQPVADMMVSLIPVQPALGPIKIQTLKPRTNKNMDSFTIGPLSNIVHDEVVIEEPSWKDRVLDAFTKRPDLAWEVLQGLKGMKLLGPWRTTDGGYDDGDYDDGDEVFIEREDPDGVVVAYVAPTGDERFHATLHEDEGVVEREERFDTFEEAMAWADRELEGEGYLLA